MVERCIALWHKVVSAPTVSEHTERCDQLFNLLLEEENQYELFRYIAGEWLQKPGIRETFCVA